MAFALFESGIRRSGARNRAYATPATLVAATLRERSGAVGEAVLAERSGRQAAGARPDPE